MRPPADALVARRDVAAGGDRTGGWVRAAAPVPAAKLEENVKPLTGLRQVTVNWPAVPVGAAQNTDEQRVDRVDEALRQRGHGVVRIYGRPKDVPPTSKDRVAVPKRDPRLNPLDPAEIVTVA